LINQFTVFKTFPAKLRCAIISAAKKHIPAKIFSYLKAERGCAMSAGRGQPTGTRLNARKWYISSFHSFTPQIPQRPDNRSHPPGRFISKGNL